MTVLHTGSPEAAGVSPARVRGLEEMCLEWINRGSTPAMSILAARHGTIFLHKAWGNLSPGPDSLPVQKDSLFGMASCSKPVTAAAVMILVDEGLINLDDPLQEYLPDFTGSDTDKITIRHLLTHTSGLPLSGGPETILTNEYDLENSPGSKMVYSSVGFDLLGKLVEMTSGQGFDEFTGERIYKPLGMHDTTFIHMGLDRKRSVQRRPGTTYDWPTESEGVTSASSSLWSTALDMGIFLQTFLNKGSYGKVQLLSPSAVDVMTQNQTNGIPRETVDGKPIPPAGLGWFLLYNAPFANYPRSFSLSSYGHSGASGAFIWVDPAFDLIGAFLFTKIKEEFRPLDLFVDTLMDCIIHE